MNEIFRIVLNNMAAIAIFSIAVLLMIREIFMFITNERRRKDGKWVYMERVRDGVIRIEEKQTDYNNKMQAFIVLEKRCNDSLELMYVAVKENHELLKEHEKRLNLICENCMRNPNE